MLYAKSLSDLTAFDDSVLQQVRRAALATLIKWQKADPISTSLQIPLHNSIPRNILDVGCGFGEFSLAYRRLGSEVTGTEVVPTLLERVQASGVSCHLGDLTQLELPTRFDMILFRAVLYRNQNPIETLNVAKGLLAKGGTISLVDPSVDEAGVRYFAFKQFPQGRFYILDFSAYSRMLAHRFGLTTIKFRQYYGRPKAPLKKVRLWGNINGFGELAWNNLTHRKPYTAAYLLTL